jgi:hypothetical protein
MHVCTSRAADPLPLGFADDVATVRPHPHLLLKRWKWT